MEVYEGLKNKQWIKCAGFPKDQATALASWLMWREIQTGLCSCCSMCFWLKGVCSVIFFMPSIYVSVVSLLEEMTWSSSLLHHSGNLLWTGNRVSMSFPTMNLLVRNSPQKFPLWTYSILSLRLHYHRAIYQELMIRTGQWGEGHR